VILLVLIIVLLGYHEKQNSINFILQPTGKSYKSFTKKYKMYTNDFDK